MNNVIPFHSPTEDREMMEAIIWETMATDEQSAGAVARFIPELKLPLLIDLVMAVADDNIPAAYNVAYTMVSEATIMAARAALEKGGKPWIG